jgi:hypothetical protein
MSLSMVFASLSAIGNLLSYAAQGGYSSIEYGLHV